MQKEIRKPVKPVEPGKGIMYGNCKVQKQQVDSCPPFQSILLGLQIPTYKLSKFLAPILNLLTKNECIIKNSFHFSEKISEQDPTFTKDVDSLFTSIPLDDTFVTCVNQLFENIDTDEGFPNSELKQVLCLDKSLISYFTKYFTNKLMM